MLIRNKRSYALNIAIPQPDGSFVEADVEPGATIDVPDELALGKPAEGTVRVDSDRPKLGLTAGDLDPLAPGYSPGMGGLLDQLDNWERAKAPRAAAEAAGEGSADQ